MYALNEPQHSKINKVECVPCKRSDKPGPEVIKLFLCSAQLSMKFFLLINVQMPTIVGILILMSEKNSILGLSEPKKKAEFLDVLYL